MKKTFREFSLSKANKQKIYLGFSPINEKTFREYFPQYDIKELYNSWKAGNAEHQLLLL
ncbi:hypothetical protein [Solibacillus ferritrahens]|uniref:hypothetical protein n=1 Tax=Solibacillus ferritrahens TaxID=3098620 RepID=UPI00300A6244